MARNLSNVNVGTAANDGSGDLLRDAFIKVNQNLTGLYQNGQFLANTIDTLGVPGYSWESDKNTGLFHPEDGVIGISLNGVEGLVMRANGYIGWRGTGVATTTYVQSQIQNISGGGTGGSGTGGLTGIPVVDQLPASGNFEGRVVILDDDGLIYIYKNGAWVALKDVLSQDAYSGIETVTAFPTTNNWDGRTVIKDNKLWIYLNGVWTDLFKSLTPNAPKGIEIWITSALPTTDLFNGRMVLWVTPSGDDRVWVYRTSSNSWVHLDDYLTPTAAGSGIPVGTSLPSTGNSEGSFFYNTTNRTLYVYTQGSWRTLNEWLGVDTVGIRTVTALPTSNNTEGDLVIYNAKIYIYKSGAWVLLAQTLTPDANGNIEIVDNKDTLTNNYQGRTVLNRADNGLYIYVDGIWKSFQQYITANASQINGIEIVGIVPNSITTGLFDGKVVFYTGDNKLYIYTSAAGWKLLSENLAPNAPTGIQIVTSLPQTDNYQGRTVIQGGAVYYYNGTEYVLLNSLITSGAAQGIDIVTTVSGLAGTEGKVVFNSTDNKLYKYSSGAWAEINFTITASADVANGSITTAKFAAGLTPVEIISAGSLPSTSNFAGRIVYWTTTSQLHRYDGTGWTNATPNTSITGTLTSDQIQSIANAKITGTIISTQIGSNAITTAKIAAGAVSTAQLAAGAITADKIATNTITANEIAAGAITASEIAANAITAVAINAGAITAGKIAAAAITATEIASGAISTDKLAANAITSEKISALAITTEKLAVGAVTANNILAGAITTAKIQAGAIGATEIAAGAVTATKIGANAITAAKIEAGAIGTEQLAASAITADKIAAATITSAKIAAGAIGTTELAANAVSADKILANAVTAGKIAAGAITATQIAANTITADKFAVGAIAAATITAGSITSDKLAANAVVAGKIAASAITAGTVAAGAIGATEIAANAITAIKLAADSVTAAKIAAGAVGADEIAANAITADKIAANNITAIKIEAGAITTDKIAANSITTAKIAPNSIDGSIIVTGTLIVDKLKSGTATLTGGSFSLGACTSLTTGGATYYAISVFESTAADKFGIIASSTNSAPALAAGNRIGRSSYGAAGIFVKSNGTTFEGSYTTTAVFCDRDWAAGLSKRTDGTATSSQINTEIFIGGVNESFIGYERNGYSANTFTRTALNLRNSSTNDYYAGIFELWDGAATGSIKNFNLLGYNSKSTGGQTYGLISTSRYNASTQGMSQAVLSMDETVSGTAGALNRAAARFTSWDSAGTIVSQVTVASTNGKSVYTGAGTVGPFTGSHDAYIDHKNNNFEIGDIVKDIEIIAKKSINDVITKVALTDNINQKSVVGVISFDHGINQTDPPSAVCDDINVLIKAAEPQRIIKTDNGESINPAIPEEKTSKSIIRSEFKVVHENLNYITINSIGEGLINVCGQNGNIEAGDLIVSSSIPGKGMKQADDIIRNYTVAKARESVTFNSLTEVKQVACTYLCG